MVQSNKRFLLPAAVLTALAIVVLALVAPTAALAEDKKAAKKLTGEMKKALGAGAVDIACEKARALGEVGGSNDTKTLLGLAFADPFPGDPKKTNQFVDAVRDALTALDDAKSNKILVGFLKKKGKPELKSMIIDILSGRTDDDSRLALEETLEDKDPSVVGLAAAALGARGSKDSVKALIAALKRLERAKGTPWFKVRTALTDITGHDMDTATDWENFWQPREETFDPATDRGDSEGVGGTVVREAPKLFGSEIISKRVVIILDTSGSMHIKDPFSGNEEATTPEGGGTTARPTPKATPQPPAGGGNAKGPCPDCSQTHAGVGLPADRQRIERAKKELTKVVNALPGDVLFNLLVYSTDVKSWQEKKLVQATPANKKSAIGFVQSLRAEGVTRSGDSLKRAFDFSEADTIYLLSDGTPTTKDGKPVPATDPDPKNESLEKIYEEVKQLNRLRKVVINTLAFQGAYKPFMTRLAQDSGGKYADIP